MSTIDIGLFRAILKRNASPAPTPSQARQMGAERTVDTRAAATLASSSSPPLPSSLAGLVTPQNSSSLREQAESSASTPQQAAQALFRLAGRTSHPSERENLYLRAAERCPEFALPHFELGKIYQQQERWEEAECSLERATHYDPTNLDAFMRLGFCYQRNEKREFEEWVDLAVAAYCGAIVAQPEFVGAWQRLGDLYMDMEDADECEKVFVEITRLQPNDFVAHWKLALARIDKNEWLRAEASLETALRLRLETSNTSPKVGEPDAAEIYLKLGDVRLKQGKWDLASHAFNQVLRSDMPMLDHAAKKGIDAAFAGVSEQLTMHRFAV